LTETLANYVQRFLGDHIVDPRINDRPHVKQAIEESEEAKATFKMTEYQGLNVSILLLSTYE
jgi:p-aminobenzoyl-glutamate transporter AbgT